MIKEIEVFITLEGPSKDWKTEYDIVSRSPTPRTRRFRRLQAELDERFQAFDVRKIIETDCKFTHENLI